MMLGRNVQHDPQSKHYRAVVVARPPKTVLHRFSAPVLDQGQVGSCTGNALAQCLNTAMFRRSRLKGAYLTESDAVTLYSRATTLDDAPGTYPPEDTGSSGLAVCKAGQQLGYLSEYRHAFSFDDFLSAVQISPVIVGTDWTEDMFTPDIHGYVKPTGTVAGGHEYLVLGINTTSRYVTCLNSWSSKWGKNGRFKVTFENFQKLLDQQGDVTVPVGARR